MNRVVDRVVSEQKSLTSRLSLVKKVPAVHRRDLLKSTHYVLNQVNDSSSFILNELSSQSDSFKFSSEAEDCKTIQTLVTDSVCHQKVV